MLLTLTQTHSTPAVSYPINKARGETRDLGLGKQLT